MVLVDTSVLARTLQPHHPAYRAASRSIQHLPEQGQTLHIVPQILIELWTVSTRPVVQNGLGMTPAAAATELQRIKSMFVLLPESPGIYPTWKALVVKYQVSGKPAHDARLVAAMQIHGLKVVLTFDSTGFSRYPDIQVIDPLQMAG